MSLELNGQDLRRKVADAGRIDVGHLKLISCGHVIEDGRSLNDQHVRVSFLTALDLEWTATSWASAGFCLPAAPGTHENKILFLI
jgi:hypothetical protein